MPRHSRQEQILQLKAVKRTWGTEFNKQLELGVKSPISRFYKYYQEQSDKAIEIFKRKGSVDAGDMVTMFTNNDYIKLYESLYESVGLRFAKWYAGNFDKFLQKAANPGANVDTWRTTFKSKGAQVAGERISLVQGSAKRNLMNVTRLLMMDDIFIESGYEDKARMLRSKFKQYNKYQAERLVRTEATFIANYATHESAKTIFPGADMQKEWISVSMGDYPRHLPKHKADHRVMDGVVVDFDKPFQVPTINGIENLMVPGDPNGSSYNVINCRCTSAPFPKPGAQAVTELQDLNFGLAGQMAEQSLYDLAEAVQTVAAETVAVANTVAKEPVKEVVEQVIEKPTKLSEVAKINDYVPNNIVELFEDSDNLNLEIFEHFKQKQLLDIKNVRAYHQLGRVVMPKSKLVSITKKTYIHETGHFVATTRKWIQVGLVEKDKAAKPLDLIFNKWSKYAKDKKNMPRLWRELEDLDGFKTFETVGKKLGYNNINDYVDDIGAINDTFGALTKEAIGGGHGKSYYRFKHAQWQEFIAHSYENRFHGNKVFEHFYKDMFDDMVKMVDELHLNY